VNGKRISKNWATSTERNIQTLGVFTELPGKTGWPSDFYPYLVLFLTLLDNRLMFGRRLARNFFIRHNGMEKLIKNIGNFRHRTSPRFFSLNPLKWISSIPLWRKHKTCLIKCCQLKNKTAVITGGGSGMSHRLQLHLPNRSLCIRLNLDQPAARRQRTKLSKPAGRADLKNVICIAGKGSNSD